MTPDSTRNVLKKTDLSLRLIKQHVMKTYGNEEPLVHAFLTSELDGGKQSASRFGLLTFWKIFNYPLDRRLGGPQSVFVLWGKKSLVITKNRTQITLHSSLHFSCRTY
jgi:hypothetical protein